MVNANYVARNLCLNPFSAETVGKPGVSSLNHSYYKELVRKPGKLQRNKQRSKDLCWKVHDPAQSSLNLLFCTHTLWPNYVTVTFLLVSSSGANYDLLCLCRVMAKKANKNIEQRILPSFLTIYLPRILAKVIEACPFIRPTKEQPAPTFSVLIFLPFDRWIDGTFRVSNCRFASNFLSCQSSPTFIP